MTIRPYYDCSYHYPCCIGYFVIEYIVIGYFGVGIFGLGELPFAPTMGRWLIRRCISRRCPLFTIHFSLFTSHRPSFQAHNDTDSGNTIVDGRDYSLSIAI